MPASVCQTWLCHANILTRIPGFELSYEMVYPEHVGRGRHALKIYNSQGA